MYENLLTPISNLNDLGMDIPEGFRVCAKYTLLSNLDKELSSLENCFDKTKVKKLTKIKQLTDKFKIKLTNPETCEILSEKLNELLNNLQEKINSKNTQELLAFFNLLEILDVKINIHYAQNVFYDMFCDDFDELSKDVLEKNPADARQLFLELVEIGKKLNINTDFYRNKIDSLTGKV